MPNILSTSLSGMLAFQRALELTGHNIANANTPGYNRQVAEFSTRGGDGTGNGFIGGGTQITTIKRIYDAALGEQLQTSTTSHARFDTLSGLASRIDGLFADPQTGLSGSLQSFFGAVQDLSNDPSSIPARQAVLSEADGIVQRFKSLDGRLSEVDAEVNQRIGIAVDDINRLADSIAELNDQVVVASARTGQPPNDLMDQRDLLLRELSTQVSVTTVAQNDGSLNVFVGSGQALVTGVDVNYLAVRGNEFDPTRSEVVFRSTNGDSALDTSLTGGAIGGLLEFRSSMLDPSRQALGETALGLVSRFNDQHTSGIDLRGELGGAFFGIDSPAVTPSRNNSGSGTADAVVANLSAVTGADYVLEYDGAAYSLVAADTGQPISLSGSGSGADPFIAEGLSITVGGTPAAGDRLMIRPARNIAGSVSTLISNPQDIAMAAPIATQSSDANSGDATIGQLQIIDPSAPNLLAGAQIEFTDATTFTIDGAGSFAYTSGEPINVNGASVVIDGVPAAGDQFTLQSNIGATGGNGNGLLLAQVQSTGIFDGGTVSINDNYGQLVAGVGGTTRQLQSNLEAQSVILTSTEDAYLSKSGVNLDEEAANLIRFQQAYQAAAQVVSVASTLFNSLLDATRR